MQASNLTMNKENYEPIPEFETGVTAHEIAEREVTEEKLHSLTTGDMLRLYDLERTKESLANLETQLTEDQKREYEELVERLEHLDQEELKSLGQESGAISRAYLDRMEHLRKQGGEQNEVRDVNFELEEERLM